MVPRENSPAGTGDHGLFRGPGPGESGLPGSEGPKPLGEYIMKGISSPPRLIQEALTVSQNALRASGLFLREMQKLAPCQMAAIYFLDESADEITTVLFGTDLSLPEEVGQIFPLARSWIEQCLHPGIPYIESAKGMQGPASADLRYRDSGIKSSFWVPLANQGRLGE